MSAVYNQKHLKCRMAGSLCSCSGSQSLRDYHRALPTKGTKRTSSNTFHHEIKTHSRQPPSAVEPPWNQGQRQAPRMSESPGLTCPLASPEMENRRVSTRREVPLSVNMEASPTSQRRKGTNPARLPPPGSVPTYTGSWDGSRVARHLQATQGSSGTRVDPLHPGPFCPEAWH